MSHVAIILQANIFGSAPGSIDCFILGESAMAELVAFARGQLSGLAVDDTDGSPRVQRFMGVPMVLSRNAQRTRLEVIHRSPIGEIEIQVLRW